MDPEFPFLKTKTNLKRSFNLLDGKDERAYFKAKCQKQIEKLKDFVREKTFIAYLLGKKNSGKGTYAKMLAKIIDPERIFHFSVGDLIRSIDEEIKDKKKFDELLEYLNKNYRGFIDLKEALNNLKERSTQNLLPTELILALIKREIDKLEKKTLLIDGFPRNLDQVSFTLFFRDLIGFRYDPDVFILIDVPDSVIEERIKWRRVCPKCQTPKNLKLLPTKEIGFDGKEFFLICDDCKVRMVPKEGDELGLEPIKKRLKEEQEMMKLALSLYGIPKIILKNTVPVSLAQDLLADYEITPEYYYELENSKVKIKQRPWKIKDDEGKESYSLLPQSVLVNLICQLVEVLGL